MEMSYHARADRLDRMVYIATHMEFGEVLLERHNEGIRECITDTGILLIKAPDKEFLITAYVLAIDKATAIYRSMGYNRIPASLYNQIVRNKTHAILSNMTEAEQKQYLKKNRKR